MNVYITPQAARNIVEIGRHVRRHSPTGSRRVRAAIEAAIRIVGEHPDVGSSMATEGIRRIVSRFGYLVYYTVEEDLDEVVILSVKHAARRRDHEPR